MSTSPIHRTMCLAVFTICGIVGSVLSQQSRNPAGSNHTPSTQTPSPASPVGETPPVFRPGDAVKILTFPDTSLFINGTYHIAGNGTIFLPLIGTTKISHLSEQSLCDLLKQCYIDHLKYPNVQVRPLVRVALQGGFVAPGLYYVPPSYSLWDVVKSAGGTAREDGIEKIRWVRNREVVSADLVPLIESGKSLNQIGFESGDQLCVTPKPKVTTWEVVKSDLFPLISLVTSTIIAGLSLYGFYETAK